MGCDLRCDFAGDFECSALPAVKALEREVLGCDYGGTSWTTAEHAGHIIRSLELGAGAHLLEVGSGSGWPGLFLAKHSGCAVTLMDLPELALQQAAERCTRDGTGTQVTLVRGDATAMPFDTGKFSRVSHSDVLCCLQEKEKMLMECRRVSSDGGRMHFSVIRPAAGLSDAGYRLVLDRGPPHVGLVGTYRDMLRRTGWRVEERVDVSAEYGECLGRLAAGLRRNTADLLQAFGADRLRELCQHREEQKQLVLAAKMKRIAYVAVAC
jgi:SAM-dependent methyltransferase